MLFWGKGGGDKRRWQEGSLANEWQSPGPCQSLLICDEFYHSLISRSSNVSMASTEREKALGWESFQFKWARAEKIKEKKKAQVEQDAHSTGWGAKPTSPGLFPIVLCTGPDKPTVWVQEWHKPWNVLVTGQLWCSWTLHWVPMRVFTEIITGTITSPRWIISLTNFVIKHFQIKYKFKKKKWRRSKSMVGCLLPILECNISDSVCKFLHGQKISWFIEPFIN